MPQTNHDVVVIGSGPAGSTAATLLADQGYDIAMIDRSQHPRFHIGESLLPKGAPILTRLGLNLRDDEFLPKHGAEFIDEKTGQSCRFPLAGEHQPFQVERAKFDHMLVSNAIERGAQFFAGEQVRSVDFSDDFVEVATDRHCFRARYLVDASGRSAFLGRKHQSISRINNLGRFALYTHFRDAESSAAEALYETGDVKVIMLDIGWFWIIPLIGNRLSVGLVVKNEDASSLRGAALFAHYRENSPYLDRLLDGAIQESPVRAEADFSFSNDKRFGSRFVCCGDAAGFLDPVFSSGVFMAVTSAERVADRIHQGFSTGTEGDPHLHAKDDEIYHFGFRSMQLFVERFYQYDLVHHLFFEAARDESIKAQIAGLLAGDLWGTDNAFQQKLLSSRQNRPRHEALGV